MSASSDKPSADDPLEPVLRDVEAKLRDRLHEACEAEASGVANESASEAGESGSSGQQAGELQAPILGLREFRDPNGQLWRAWPVTPGQARRGRHAERYLGEFHKGWICFEALESSARRRLPQQPERWTDLQ